MISRVLARLGLKSRAEPEETSIDLESLLKDY